MSDKQPENVTTGERAAIRTAVDDAMDKAMHTPAPTSISASDMEASIGRRCDACRGPSGSIGQLWSAVNPINAKLWVLTGALALLGTMLTYMMPRINSKLDAIDGMARDVAVMKVQVQMVLDGRIRASEQAADMAHYAGKIIEP